MAFKLTKKEMADLDDLIGKFETARADLVNYLDDVAGDWENDFADKSEKWQEGEAGQAAQERIDNLRAAIDELSDDTGINAEDFT